LWGLPYFTQEFKDSAVKQVIEGGHPPKEVRQQAWRIRKIYLQLASPMKHYSEPGKTHRNSRRATRGCQET